MAAAGKQELLKLAKEKLKSKPEVALIKATGYWGAPIGRRMDRSDSMCIVAAAKLRQTGRMLFVQGARNGNWHINVPMIEGLGEFDTVGGNGIGFRVERIGMVDDYDIMSVSFDGQNHFPDEFVIRVDSADSSFYDNNNGTNYHITPYAYAFCVR